MTAISPRRLPEPAGRRTVAEELLPKIPFWGTLQNLGYSVALTQVAVGIVSALYVLITQAAYFGHSFKGTWDRLDLLWHFHGVPLIGGWMVAHWDIFRHVYLRDAPESVLAFALVAMIVVKWKNLKDKTPLMDRVLVKLRMPSPYQGQAGRHPDTSPLQFLFLLPSMLIIALPGEILVSAAVFGGMALASKQGYHSPWLTAQSPWVPIVIGIAGGALAGHKPAVKAGRDVQRYFLGKRLAATYAAGDILSGFELHRTTLEEARDKLTGMRRTTPGVLFPVTYQLRYASLLARHEPAQRHGKAGSAVTVGFVLILIVLAGYGLYVRKWGISHPPIWMP
jgi:hypothetical protein